MQTITDYIAKSLLTTKGDLIQRGTTAPERLASVTTNQWMRSWGENQSSGWTPSLGGATNEGDLIVRDTDFCVRLAAVALGQVLKSAGVATKPAWGVPSLADFQMASGGFIRNTAGNEVISGLGFQPGLVFLFTADQTSNVKNFSIGIDNGTVHVCYFMGDDGAFNAAGDAYSIYIRRSVSDTLYALISVLGGDGFTLLFTENGSCSCSVKWLAIG